MKQDVGEELDKLQARVQPLQRLISRFNQSLSRPDYIEKDQVFRYLNPDARHFCLLKGVRAVSALNATIELARKGYTQEIFVLVRTIVECTSHIEYVIGASLSEGKLSQDIKKFVDAYFGDVQRDSIEGFRHTKTPQIKVHESVGTVIDNIVHETNNKEFEGIKSERLMSRLYLAFSAYVHARYPEVMDLYGGRDWRFHTEGMLGTPRDAGNVAHISSQITSVSQTLALMVQAFDLISIVDADPILIAWYKTNISD